MNKEKCIGIFFVIIALFFGINVLNYNVGTFANPGPGLFPLISSILLFSFGIFTIINGFSKKNIEIDFKIKNILIILFSLMSFVLATKYIHLVFGIIFLISISSFATKNYSIVRVIKISAVLSAIVLIVKFFNLNLLP